MPQTTPTTSQRRAGATLPTAWVATLIMTLAAALAAPLAQGEETTMQHAKGEFGVKIVPLPLAGPVEDAGLGRMSIEKEFQGDLVGSGKGQMLTAASAAYVAIERVEATLAGRHGTFVLQHRGVAEGYELLVTVVPDSGTGELAGLRGELTIEVRDGKHFYDLQYTLPSAVP